MPTYQSNISLIGGLPSTWAAAAWIHPCTGARSALTPHWASAAACRRGTRPPQVLKTQGAKGCSRRTGPISQRRYSTADRLAREGYRGLEMSRCWCRVKPADEQILVPLQSACPECGRAMRIRYSNRRAIVSLRGLVRLRLKIRRCESRSCGRYHQAWRPEAEAALALPQHEFGLDVIALVGALRYREHRSVPEIHQELSRRGVAICERSVTNLLERYDELVAASAGAAAHRETLERQGRAILAIDGLQPDVGHEVLWVIRECLSGLVLLARALLSSACPDLAGLLREVAAELAALGVPVVGVVSDGQHSIRLAVGKVWPDVPHQLCHFHYLREAALPIFEADRHAKKELKKTVHGVRPIERRIEGRTDAAAQIVQGYCAAVRSALTDDGRPPLEAAGLRLHDRLEAVEASLGRIEEKGELCQRS